MLTEFQIDQFRKQGFHDAVNEKHTGPRLAHIRLADHDKAWEAYDAGHREGQKEYVRRQEESVEREHERTQG